MSRISIVLEGLRAKILSKAYDNVVYINVAFVHEHVDIACSLRVGYVRRRTGTLVGSAYVIVAAYN